MIGSGIGDMTYNTRKNILGAISVNGKTAYHLFKVEHDGSDSRNNVKLLRKTKLHSLHQPIEDARTSTMFFHISLFFHSKLYFRIRFRPYWRTCGNH